MSLAPIQGALSRRLWGTVEIYRLVALLLVVAAPAIAFWLSIVKKDRWVALLLVLQLVLAAATWLLGEAKARTLEVERIIARQETLVALGDLLDPVTVELAKIAGLPKPDRRNERSGVVQLVLAAATGLAPEATRPRACYFKLNDNSANRGMTHQASVGRSVPAKAEFAAGTLAGDTALAMIDSAEHLFCDDVDESPPPGWEPSQRGEYKTFISVTVASGSTPFGMLTVDATEAGSLTAEDVAMLRVLGHVLGSAEALCA